MYLLFIGQVYMTPAALSLVNDKPSLFGDFIDQHRCGNWGNIHLNDKEANDEVVQEKDGGHLLSVYMINGKKFWIDTVGFGTDDVYTVIMLPSEYEGGTS